MSTRAAHPQPDAAPRPRDDAGAERGPLDGPLDGPLGGGGPRYGRGEAWLTPARLASLVAVLIGAYLSLTVVVALRTVLVMLLVALFLSFAMEPAVQWLSRRGWRRGAATGAVFFAVFLVAAGILWSVGSMVIGQVTGLVSTIPRSLEELDSVLPELPFGLDLSASPQLREQLDGIGGDVGERLRAIAFGAAGNVVNIGATAFGLLFQVLSIALVTFYLVADGPRARRALARPLPAARQREMLAIWELAVAKTGGYIYSRVVLAAACAAATTAFLVVLGVANPIPLGLFVAVTSAFVPVVGAYLGGLLLLLVAFDVREPLNALWVTLFLVVYQQVENYLLAPRIQARTMDVHPAVAFVSVLAGGTLLGAIGALLALPATAIAQALLSTYVRRHELIEELSEVPLPAEAVPRAGGPTRLRRATERELGA